jgi:L-arabinose isomerase
MSPARPRIAIVSGYMPFFDEIMPRGYREDRDALGRSTADVVADVGDAVYCGLADSRDAGLAIGRRIAEIKPDAILVAPTMATPADFLWSALEPHPDRPVVLWAAHEMASVPRDYDMPMLCRHSSNVGALMIGNMLNRHGRRPLVIVGPRDDESTRQAVKRAMASAVVAGHLRHARIGRIGRPLDGYLNVDVDQTQLRDGIGAEIIDIPLEEWEAAVAAASEESVGATAAYVREHALIDDRGASSGAEQSLRVTTALGALIKDHRLDAGALNYWGEFGIANPKIGVVGSLAATVATSTGVPFACTGDLITAVAMLVGKRLGGGALYCELDAIDYGRDAFLCANTGEGDFAYSVRGGLSSVFATGASSGRRVEGLSVRHLVPAGPATMIGFSPRRDATGGFVLVAMEGEVQEPPDTSLEVTQAWFSARRKPMSDALATWITAGATHHGSLSPGHLAAGVASVARILGIAVEVI